jgi:hypothetical protein
MFGSRSRRVLRIDPALWLVSKPMAAKTKPLYARPDMALVVTLPRGPRGAHARDTLKAEAIAEQCKKFVNINEPVES